MKQKAKQPQIDFERNAGRYIHKTELNPTIKKKKLTRNINALISPILNTIYLVSFYWDLLVRWLLLPAESAFVTVTVKRNSLHMHSEILNEIIIILTVYINIIERNRCTSVIVPTTKVSCSQNELWMTEMLVFKQDIESLNT
jgi:hypothetical protein